MMIVQTDDLVRHFRQGHGLLGPARLIRAVDGVSLSIEAGTCLGVVGESGSGKSTLGRLLLGLDRPTSGTVQVLGRDLTQLDRRSWRATRRDLALIHQNPRAALDPRWPVGATVAEPLRIHEPRMSSADVATAGRSAFDAVGLPSSLMERYPHQLSGGQRQRVVIARALVLNPKLIVMDEPTSALDVSVQAQVMALIGDLKARFSLTYVFISHDLRNLRRIADRLAVMYAGTVVEIGPAASVCRIPAHPYTAALVDSIPTLDQTGGPALDGEPPDPTKPVRGCAFAPRCRWRIDRCTVERPILRGLDQDRMVACHRPMGPVVPPVAGPGALQ